jgi:hypothetical protein
MSIRPSSEIVRSTREWQWAQSAVLAQDDDASADVITELKNEVGTLREEVGLLKDQIATLEERVAQLEGVPAPIGSTVVGRERLVGTWVRTSGAAEAHCEGSVFICARKSDVRDLALRADGTYSWGEKPYEAGNYEVFDAGGSTSLDIVNLDVVLIGDGGLRCVAHYDGMDGVLWIEVPRCPGMFAEPDDGGEPLELDSGYIQFSPAR